MSVPVRFLALLVVGWAGVRAATLGIVPGFTVSYAKPLARSDPPAIVATRFPELPPLGTEPPQMWPQGLATPYPASMPPPVRARLPVPYYLPYPYAVSASLPQARIPPRPAWQLPSTAASGASGAPAFYTPIPPIEDWELGRYASASFPERRSSAAPAALAQPPGRQTLDRLQLSSWALLRGAPGPGTLASGGTLGGSQAGARLTYAFNHRVAASLRTTSPVGGSTGAEVAGGIRLTPFPSIPVAFTIERRQSINPHGGRSAFAAFFEGGLYRQPMPLDFNLDAYV